MSQGDIRVAMGEVEQFQLPPDSTVYKNEQAHVVYNILIELLSSENINALFADFALIVDLPIAIIDLQGNVLASSRWQNICVNFHRVHSDSCAKCIESDIELANNLEEQAEYSSYQCKNGLVDCAAPIIIDGQHIANLFIGQFLLSKPDISFFKAQASQYQFNEALYLAALHELPVVNETRAKGILKYLTGFARLIATLSLEKYNAEQEGIKFRQTLTEKNQQLQDINQNLENLVSIRTAELERLAYIDDMTGIYNRRMFFELATPRFNNSNHVIAVMIDIDLFKAINDTYGHSVGDKVIIELASFISGYLNDGDIFARLGGEEFVILFLAENFKEIQKKIELLRLEIQNLTIKTNKDELVSFTISSDFAHKTADTSTIDDLLRCADEALYKAKNTGRNRVVYYGSMAKE